MDSIADCQENDGPQDNVAAVKKGVFLKLLVASGVLAVALGRIDYPAAGDTLCLAGKAEYPSKTDDCRHDDHTSQNAHSHSQVRDVP